GEGGPHPALSSAGAGRGPHALLVVGVRGSKPNALPFTGLREPCRARVRFRLGVLRNPWAIKVYQASRGDRVGGQRRIEFVITSRFTVVDPLTRRAPADENAGGAPPSP